MGKYDDLIIFAVGGIATYFLISTCTLQSTVGQLFSSMNQPNPLNDIFKEIEGAIGITGCGDFPGGTAPGGGGGTTPPTGGGGFSTGAGCPSGGETCQEDGQGRYDCNDVTADSYEATWCGSFSGDQMTVKLYGPNHSGSNCCWCNLIIHENGQFAVGGEGPHPRPNCEHETGESMGGTSDVCIKAVIRPGPTWEGYALEGGQWVQKISYTGPCGCSNGEESNEKTGNQVTFRVDGNFQTECATVVPLGAGGAITPPASGGGGGGNGNGNGGGGGGGSTTPTPTSPNRPAPNNPADPCVAFRNSPGTWCGCRTARGLSCANYARSRFTTSNIHLPMGTDPNTLFFPNHLSNRLPPPTHTAFYTTTKSSKILATDEPRMLYSKSRFRRYGV